VISRNVCAISTTRRSPLSRWTTIRVGGPADEIAFPRTTEDVAALVARAAARGEPWRALGKGSNLLVDDGGVRGVVIHTRDLDRVRFGAGGRVTAGAGVKTSVLLGQALRRGLGGLECLVGYPATVGGAVRMNAGGKWGETGARVESVVVVDEAGEVRTLAAPECRFGYRTSAFARSVVAEVTFVLPEVDVAAYRERIRAIHREKAAVQPLREASAGCVFRNPAGTSAGRLVDQCGLKGRRRGGAAVSEVHGNFVVNRGGATSDDVLRLIEDVRREVERRAGVVLAMEVEVWRDHVPAVS
jgi:UDP-N-acetylmuramate dehydrogenase